LANPPQDSEAVAIAIRIVINEFILIVTLAKISSVLEVERPLEMLYGMLYGLWGLAWSETLDELSQMTAVN
jgi:hypothetical protein